ncbi:MAG: tetratricopeptide repeat protein, partial [Planctomycetota bacterium]
MKNPSLIKSLCHLKFICIGLTIFACIFLVTCCGCGKKEEVAENPVEFKEIVATEAESLTGKTDEGPVSLDAKQSEPKQPVEVITRQSAPEQPVRVGKTTQSNQPIVVKPVTALDLYNKGLECFSQGRLGEAVEAFSKATDMDATMVDAHKKKALAYNKLGMMSETIASFKKVVELNPNDTESYLNLGTFYAKRQMTDDAISAFERYVSLNTNNAKVYYNLGCLYGRKKLADRAIVNYQQAIKINPNYVDAYYNLGTAYND